MSQQELNLGIVAHVDAGKTTLTERLLYEADVIDHVGSVDAGTTQTDSLALEQQRGITIKSAVVAFSIRDVHVNLIDTPGHPDFIAEVERVLSVLDGAVLVISAVEGVQPQTRVLVRALKRLRVPTLVFVNKMDRAGADYERVLREIHDRLAVSVLPVEQLASSAELLAEYDERLLAAYIEDVELSEQRLHDALATQTKQALVHPAFAGSAKTGAGVDALMNGIADFLPAASGDPEAPVSATVFKIERGPKGEKIAYVRLYAGTIHVREQLGDDKVTEIAVFEQGPAEQRPAVAAGQVAKVWGLQSAQIGDRIGEGASRARHHFPPPTLEAVVVARNRDDGSRLRLALAQLAEQDPLINVRVNELQEVSVSLYGEVQQEVIEAILADDYDIDVDFRDVTTICIERPLGVGEAIELLQADTNPFHATVGLRIEPGPVDSGLEFRLAVDPNWIPLYTYKKRELFAESMERYVRDGLCDGLCGWEVTDCVVTMTDVMYMSADGPPSMRGPLPTASDFRKLTPIVLRRALEQAGTLVCEPTLHVTLEVPARALGAVMSALARLGGVVEAQSVHGELAVIETLLSVASTRELQRQLSGLTAGEGVLESAFAGYQPVIGEQPVCPRSFTSDARAARG